MNDCFQNLTRLYLDKATLVWNGNAVTGQDALGEFFESLPSSEFQVHTLDCQPVHGMQTKYICTLIYISYICTHMTEMCIIIKSDTI